MVAAFFIIGFLCVFYLSEIIELNGPALTETEI